MNYKIIKLKDIVDITMGQSPKGSSYNHHKEGKPFLQGNRTFGRLYPKIDTWTKEPKKIAKKDSILMSVRAPVGDLNIADQDICIGRGLCSITMKNNNNQYLYYLLKNNIQQIKKKSTGTIFPSINRTELEELEILNFSIEQQNKISNILSKIDSKIELNNQINNNLFKIIKQYLTENYYKNDSIRKKEMSNIGKVQGGYAFKSKDLLEEETDNKIFKIKNISKSGVDVENTQYISNEVANKVDSKFELFRGDVIVAMTGAELGKTGYLYGNKYRYFLNQRVGTVTGFAPEKTLFLNCIFLLDEVQTLLNSKGYGSAQPNISTSDIEKTIIPIPNEKDLARFHCFANPIYNKIILKSEENQKLEQLRDTLLPKLMNGEMDLDKIEI